MNNITRRQAIAGLGVAASTCTAFVAHGAELPIDRVERLSQELAEALNDWNGASFRAEVYPSSHPIHSTLYKRITYSPSVFAAYNGMLPAADRFEHHLGMALYALAELSEGASYLTMEWEVAGDLDHGLSVVRRSA
ncbi:hypothetical protein [Shinella sp.]|uniref:hypothetical protein n=1 Tax=Shinella sp. TaxID=1870904 RepID=UPI0029AE0639|nr:hypothetical protein [Shinella sp.]MDX3975798.1 hypothetical protein [Shinella sp.]